VSSSAESDNDHGAISETVEIRKANPNGVTEDVLPISVSSIPTSHSGNLENFEFHPSNDANYSIKGETRRFWNDFRTICVHFRCRLDELLLVNYPPPVDGRKAEDSAWSLSDEERQKEIQIQKIRTHYATAAKRKEGRSRLDELLGEVRLLRGHCLNASSSMSSCSYLHQRTEECDSEKIASPQHDDSNSDNISNSEADSENIGTKYGSSSNGESHDTGNNNNDIDDRNDHIRKKNLLQSILQNPMPEISTTELRLLTRDLESILNAIDEAREWISPKEKFVFRRYRLAMEEKALEKLNTHVEIDAGGNVTNDVRNKEKNTTSSRNHHEYLKARYGGIVENMTDCIVEVLPDGTLRINEISEEELQKHALPKPCDAAMACSNAMGFVSGSREALTGIPSSKILQTAATTDNVTKKMTDSTATTAATPAHNQSKTISSSASSPSSYLLRNLSNTTILLHLPHLLSLHLHNISHCRIYVTQPTLGPVHVTKCHSSHVQCSCYQLRVHESTNVRFRVWTRSGPIIEDCSGMVFDGDYFDDDCDTNSNSNSNLTNNAESPRKNMFWDVKDFNWLRTLKKSPNFEVIARGSDRVVHESIQNIDKGSVATLGNPIGCSVDSVAPAEEAIEGTGDEHDRNNDVEDSPPLDDEDSEDEL